MIRKLRLKFIAIIMSIVLIMLCIMFGMLYSFTKKSLEKDSLFIMREISDRTMERDFREFDFRVFDKRDADSPDIRGKNAERSYGGNPEDVAQTNVPAASGSEKPTEVPSEKPTEVPSEKPADKGARQRNFGMPYFVISIDSSGSRHITNNSEFNTDDEAFVDYLIEVCNQSGKETGTIDEYNLRFFVRRTGGPEGQGRLKGQAAPATAAASEITGVPEAMGAPETYGTQAAAAGAEESGTLRTTVRPGEPGTWSRQSIVFADISMEKSMLSNMLRTNSMIAAAGFAAAFVISILLSIWATGPVDRAWKQQKQFIADASHELKTPVTVILTNAELAAAESGFPETAGFDSTVHAPDRKESAGYKADVQNADSFSSIEPAAYEYDPPHTEDSIESAVYIHNGQNAAKSTLQQKQYIDNILTVSRRMKELIEQMLELARSDSDVMNENLVMTRLNMSSLVIKAVLPFEAVLFEKGHLIETDIDEGISVFGDETKLSQLTEILLDNASKYASEGSRISISLQRGSGHTGQSCILKVSNKGEAIAQEDLKNLFKRFYRVDKARSSNGSFGLGLAIAESIVIKHKGRIWAESCGGINSFAVQLPAET